MLPQLANEAERLAALNRLQTCGAASELHLNAICRSATNMFEVPIALVTLIDDTSVSIEASCGTEAVSFPREIAFCNHTIESASDEALVIHDLLLDERFAASPLVTGGPQARFYAGVPIALQPGLNIGTLCLMDRVPRPDFEAEQVAALQDWN